MRATNIVNGESFAADWIVDAPFGWQGRATITTPAGPVEFETLAQAVLYRDCITTRSKSGDRVKRGARG